jgi:hypothetical protein
VLLAGGGASKMAAQIADEIRSNAPLHETPRAVGGRRITVTMTAIGSLFGAR